MTGHELARAFTRRAIRTARRVRQRAHDAVAGSGGGPALDAPLARLLPTGFGAHDDPSLAPVTAHYLAHRFDLLGSGWVEVRHGARALGVEGHRYPPGPEVSADRGGGWLRGRIDRGNLAHSRRIWALVDDGYVPIDWQLDYKSGYRWSERTWYRRIRYGVRPGADVKVPWELSRMQHLPELAVEFTRTRAPALPREFRNQVLDWIATNPVRFGVNWVTTMDVAIRAANWLVAYDLFRAAGAEFDSQFERELGRSVMAHGRHIVENLEWSERGAANHYLANVGGLLVIGAYLPGGPTADAWLAFAIQQMIAEVDRQFLPDGGHFESSTAYHGLCTEIVLCGTALALALPPERLAAMDAPPLAALREGPGLRPEPVTVHTLPGRPEPAPFPSAYLERLQRAVELTLHVTKPSGRTAQVGDNDSGRFIRVRAPYEAWAPEDAVSTFANLSGYAERSADGRYWRRVDLDHRELVAWGRGLLGVPGRAAAAESGIVRDVARLVGARAPWGRAGAPPAEAVRVGRPEELARHHEVLGAVPGSRRQSSSFPADGSDLRAGLRLAAYPDFGLYVMSSPRLHLVLRCGGIRHDGSGGHAHNDQLMMELTVDGLEVGADPGSYLYTALPAWRNAYRSAHAHPAPSCAECEPAPLDAGLFTLAGDPAARCLHWTEAGFVGTASLGCGTVTRVVSVGPSAVDVADYYVTRHAPRPADVPAWRAARPVPYSDGYGVRRR